MDEDDKNLLKNQKVKIQQKCLRYFLKDQKVNLCQMKLKFRLIFPCFSGRGFNGVFDKRISGEIICEDTFLIVRHEERFKINVKIGFLKVVIMKETLVFGTVDWF